MSLASTVLFAAQDALGYAADYATANPFTTLAVATAAPYVWQAACWPWGTAKPTTPTDSDALKSADQKPLTGFAKARSAASSYLGTATGFVRRHPVLTAVALSQAASASSYGPTALVSGVSGIAQDHPWLAGAVAADFWTSKFLDRAGPTLNKTWSDFKDSYAAFAAGQESRMGYGGAGY